MTLLLYLSSTVHESGEAVRPPRCQDRARVNVHLSWSTVALIRLIRVYQATLSPDHGFCRVFFLHGVCRFTPTCSAYAVTALREYGAIRGSILSLQRLLRCHPLSRGGVDPVPLPTSSSASVKEALGYP